MKTFLLTITTFTVSVMLAVTGADLVLCKDSDATYHIEENVLSPKTTDIPASQGSTPCNLRIDGIPSGSWVGVINMGQFRNMYASPSKSCNDQEVFLHISYSGNRLCLYKDEQEVVFTGYSASLSALEFQLTSSLMWSTGYRPQKVDFRLTYRVARAVHTGINKVVEEEGQQEDCIVSHSTYPAPYAADIDSTLVLTGLKLATTVDITFQKINLSSDCSDYVEISGLRVADGQSAVGRKICDNLLLDKTVQFHTVSSHISFHFQTKHAAGGQGFRLKYKVNEAAGCPEINVPYSRVTHDESDTNLTFVITCDEGYYFENTSNTLQQVHCESGQWHLIINCTEKCHTSSDALCIETCQQDNQIGQLQCVCREEDKLSSDGVTCKHLLTGGEIAGISVAVGLIFIIAILFIVLIILRQKHLLTRKDKTNHTYSIGMDKQEEGQYSPPLIGNGDLDLNTKQEDLPHYHVLDNSAAGVYGVVQLAEGAGHHHSATSASKQYSLYGQEAVPYATVPLTALKSDEVVMEVNDLYNFS